MTAIVAMSTQHRPSHTESVGTGRTSPCTAAGCRGAFSFAWNWPTGTPRCTPNGEHADA